MDNKDYLIRPKSPEDGGNNFPDFSEERNAEETGTTIDEIDRLSGSVKKEEDERPLSMPPSADVLVQEKRADEGVGSEIVVNMGNDGKISGSEFSNLKNQVVRMSDDPARLNDAIQGLSERINGGGK